MAKSRQYYKKKQQDDIRHAKIHIDSLLSQAKDVDNISLAHRYVTLARKVAMKFKVRFTPQQRRLFCPHCYRFMRQGHNVRVRVHEHRVIYYCLDCKKFWRKPLNTRSKSSKQ